MGMTCLRIELSDDVIRRGITVLDERDCAGERPRVALADPVEDLLGVETAHA
jgi:hypothetical protein